MKLIDLICLLKKKTIELDLDEMDRARSLAKLTRNGFVRAKLTRASILHKTIYRCLSLIKGLSLDEPLLLQCNIKTRLFVRKFQWSTQYPSEYAYKYYMRMVMNGLLNKSSVEARYCE